MRTCYVCGSIQISYSIQLAKLAKDKNDLGEFPKRVDLCWDCHDNIISENWT